MKISFTNKFNQFVDMNLVALVVVALFCLLIEQIKGFQIPSSRWLRKGPSLKALIPGVLEKVEEIKKEYLQLLQDHPEFAQDLSRDVMEADLSVSDETGEDFDMFNQIPDKIDASQPPFMRAQVMKSIIDCYEALKEIEEDLRMCRERRKDKEARTREIAEGFENELMEIKLGMEEELNKIIE